MTSQSPTSTRLIFGDFVIDTKSAQLLRHECAIDLRPKSFDVLCRLVESAEQVVSRDELAMVWQGRVATDESIAQCISDIRRALSDTDQHLLQTVPRRGYVLKLQVQPAPQAAPSQLQAPAQAPVQVPTVVAGRPSIVVMPFTNLSGEGARLDLLARGFTEDVTTGLARYPQLFVIGRESAVSFGVDS